MVVIIRAQRSKGGACCSPIEPSMPEADYAGLLAARSLGAHCARFVLRSAALAARRATDALVRGEEGMIMVGYADAGTR